MGLEIERKFLVIPEHLPLLGRGLELEQFYLSYDPAIRVRITDKLEGMLNFKGPGTLSRFEHEIPVGVFDLMPLRAIAKGRLLKRRHRIEHEGHVWEVDRFTSPFELWLAEIELSEENEKFALPPWAGLEVTEDKRYSNASLAEKGPPK